MARFARLFNTHHRSFAESKVQLKPAALVDTKLTSNAKVFFGKLERNLHNRREYESHACPFETAYVVYWSTLFLLNVNLLVLYV